LDAVKFGLPLYQPSNWLGMPGFFTAVKEVIGWEQNTK